MLQYGSGYDIVNDPLEALQDNLQSSHAPRHELSSFSEGAVGYLSFDCVRYFEPSTALPDLKDALQIPDAMFMIYDTVLIFNHFHSNLVIVTHIDLPQSLLDDIEPACRQACAFIQSILARIQQDDTPLPPQMPTDPAASSSNSQYVANVGQSGHESFVTKLKEHILTGDIVQAVPSQRLSRTTSVHPFDIYRNLRLVNPSPYLFYVSCSSFSILGASPERLMSASTTEDSNTSKVHIVNHAIAGTIHRGKSAAENAELARQLQNSAKDRAEHVMLVDLARNDINRVCEPQTVQVDHLTRVQKFSHAQHLTSEISDISRPGLTRWDAL